MLVGSDDATERERTPSPDVRRGDERPGGRTARTRAEVHRATLDLLADREPTQISVPVIAEAAGVHAATIYRRWGGLSGVLDDVVGAQLDESSPVPDTGSLRGDVEAWARSLDRDLSGLRGQVFVRALMLAASSPRQGDYLAGRTQQLQRMLDRAAERGERVPHVLDLFDLVVAPLYAHVIFGYPAPPDEVERVVERLFAAPWRPVPSRPER